MPFENPCHRHFLAPFDHFVQIDERPLQSFGETPPHGGLPRPHEPGQIDSFYFFFQSATLGSISPIESPPNFSSIASASTRHTKLSPITAAAGTAHASDRSM